MSQMAGAVAAFPVNSAGQLKARARGALICALFGSAWMYWAVVFSGHPTAIWFATLTSLFRKFWAILRVRAFRRLTSSPSDRGRGIFIADAARRFSKHYLVHVDWQDVVGDRRHHSI